MDTEVLKKVDIPGGDPRWPASVWVERRTKTAEGKMYINAIVALGKKRIFIPRRIIRAVGEALLDLDTAASEAYTELLEENNPSSRGEEHLPESFRNSRKRR